MRALGWKNILILNNELRAKGKNDFEKNFFKLMNNIRNRRDIHLVTSEEEAKKFVKKINYKTHTIFSKTLAVVHMSKFKLVFNKPVYLGMCFLKYSIVLK